MLVQNSDDVFSRTRSSQVGPGAEAKLGTSGSLQNQEPFRLPAFLLFST